MPERATHITHLAGKKRTIGACLADQQPAGIDRLAEGEPHVSWRRRSMNGAVLPGKSGQQRPAPVPDLFESVAPSRFIVAARLSHRDRISLNVQ
jgi:hypothetical protein